MSNAQEFRAGELVDITIKAARVLDVTGTHPPTIHFIVATMNGNVSWSMPLDHQQISVERVAPPEWPPRPGDLWCDRDGSVWFTFRDPRGWLAMQVDNPPSDWKPEPHVVLGRHGPLTLVHRKPEGGAS